MSRSSCLQTFVWLAFLCQIFSIYTMYICNRILTVNFLILSFWIQVGLCYPIFSQTCKFRHMYIGNRIFTETYCDIVTLASGLCVLTTLPLNLQILAICIFGNSILMDSYYGMVLLDPARGLLTIPL